MQPRETSTLGEWLDFRADSLAFAAYRTSGQQIREPLGSFRANKKREIADIKSRQLRTTFADDGAMRGGK